MDTMSKSVAKQVAAQRGARRYDSIKRELEYEMSLRGWGAIFLAFSPAERERRQRWVEDQMEEKEPDIVEWTEREYQRLRAV